VQGELGQLNIATPRDRNGTFEPLLIPKYERRLAGFDEKVLALYAKGMSTRDIQELVKTLYGVELSPTLISTRSCSGFDWRKTKGRSFGSMC
jgi:putative transposase